MPKFGTRYPVVLSTDKGRDPAPTFHLRTLACRDWMNLSDIEDAMIAATSVRDALDKMHEGIKIALVGWEHMSTDDPELAAKFGVTAEPGKPVDLPFKPDLLTELASIQECQELLRAALHNGAEPKAEPAPEGDAEKPADAPAEPVPA